MKLSLSEEKCSIIIPMDEIFGQKVGDSEIREMVADDLIATIIKRTQSGRGVENGAIVKFKSYSKKYSALTGKARSKVDLDQNGDLLNSIELLNSTASQIEIGIEGDQAPKAHGHMTGQYGKGPLPRRSFLGLTESDLKKIKSKYKSDVEKNKTTASMFKDSTAQKLGFTADDVRTAIEMIKQGKIGF